MPARIACRICGLPDSIRREAFAFMARLLTTTGWHGTGCRAMDMPPALFAARDLDSDNDLVPLAAVFSALGHKHRLRILRALLQSDEPLSVPQLRVLVSGPATVLEHLKTLKAAGFVEIVGLGRASKWQVVPGSLDRAAGLIQSNEN